MESKTDIFELLKNNKNKKHNVYYKISDYLIESLARNEILRTINNSNQLNQYLDQLNNQTNDYSFTFSIPEISLKSVKWKANNGLYIKIDVKIDVKQHSQTNASSSSSNKTHAKEMDNKENDQTVSIPISLGLNVMPMIKIEDNNDDLEEKKEKNENEIKALKVTKIKAGCVSVTPSTDIDLIDNINNNVSYFAFNVVDSIISTSISQVNQITKGLDKFFGIKINNYDNNPIVFALLQIKTVIEQLLHQKEWNIVKLTRLFAAGNKANPIQFLLGFERNELKMVKDGCVFVSTCKVVVQ